MTQVSHRAFGSGILLLVGGAVTIQWLMRVSILHIANSFSAGWIGIDNKEYFTIVVPPAVIVLSGGILFVLGVLPWYLNERILN
ncbi:hypothetical protein [Haladaptatus halobius]|uniref:hypothetical protein n=1 Tax=Haladaptatus halobius TaxID=2884875 RepID=UPI001D0A3631|nr:hypothetical protein [Haladaptatus halobius]